MNFTQFFWIKKSKEAFRILVIYFLMDQPTMIGLINLIINI